MTPTPPSDKERKKLALLTVALHCFTSEGFSATTEQVSQWAGIAKGSLFTHFKTKEDLIREAATHAQNLLCQEVVPGPNFPHDTVYDGLRRLWQALTQQAIRHPHALHYHLLYEATYRTREAPQYPRLKGWDGVDRLLIRTANLPRRQGEWLAMLLETQWQKATQQLLLSETADPAHPWGGALSAFAFQSWWMGVGLSTTHPMRS
jgi:AcrR family transcriptional regulator